MRDRNVRERRRTRKKVLPKVSLSSDWISSVKQDSWCDAVSESMQSHIFFCCRLDPFCVYFEFLFVDIDGVSCTLKWNLFCSSDTRESTWSGPCILKMCLKITGSFPTFADSVCKQVASWRTSSDNRQQVKSSWYTLRCAQQLPTIIMQHEKRRRIYLWNRWFDAMIYDPFRCRLRLRLRLMTNGSNEY